MSREEVIEKYFLNVKLERDYLDLYHVRNSIANSLRDKIQYFQGTILDVGCGIMPYRELVLTSNKKVTRYIGLDFEESIHQEYDLGKPDLFWKGEVIPMTDSSVDVIIATEFFEHCAEPERVMREMLRVLRPGGLLFFTVPFLWNLHVVPFDEYRYTPFSLERHLRNSGFVNIELKSLGGWDASLAQMLALWHRQRRMRPFYRRIFGYLLAPIIRRLVKLDKRRGKLNAFENGTMLTGISGTAFKNMNQV